MSKHTSVFSSIFFMDLAQKDSTDEQLKGLESARLAFNDPDIIDAIEEAVYQEPQAGSAQPSYGFTTLPGMFTKKLLGNTKYALLCLKIGMRKVSTKELTRLTNKEIQRIMSEEGSISKNRIKTIKDDIHGVLMRDAPIFEDVIPVLLDWEGKKLWFGAKPKIYGDKETGKESIQLFLEKLHAVLNAVADDANIFPTPTSRSLGDGAAVSFAFNNWVLEDEYPGDLRKPDSGQVISLEGEKKTESEDPSSVTLRNISYDSQEIYDHIKQHGESVQSIKLALVLREHAPEAEEEDTEPDALFTVNKGLYFSGIKICFANSEEVETKDCDAEQALSLILDADLLFTYQIGTRMLADMKAGLTNQ